LELLKHRPANSKVVFVGDLVNKGPNSAECIKIARDLDALCIKGNHELAVLGACENRAKPGAKEANVDARYEWTDALSQEEVDWIKALPYTITFPDYNSIIVHAGLIPGKPLHEQKWVDMTCMRDAIPQQPGGVAAGVAAGSGENASAGWVGTETPTATSVPWASTWQGPQHVYFGHDAQRQLQQYEHATGLDTGCLYGFKLTAVSLPGGELHSVDAHAVHVKPAGPPLSAVGGADAGDVVGENGGETNNKLFFVVLVIALMGHAFNLMQSTYS
jgi:hypothetical protein